MMPYIYLYPPEDESLNLEEIKNYIESKIGAYIKIRKKFFVEFKKPEKIAEEIAKIKIKNPFQKIFYPPLPVEIENEIKIMEGKSKTTMPYDAIELMKIFQKILPKEERKWEKCHIIFTNRLIATWEGNRYHLRVSLYGYPCIISMSGLIEAPAKPREFYLRWQAGENYHLLKKEFKDKILDYGDERIPKIIIAYVLQAIFYHVFEEPFCNDVNCMLYNAHWQEELFYKLENNLCDKHKKMLQRMSD